MLNKKKYLLFLYVFSTIVQANSSLENDLINFVDNKFQSEKYENLDFYNVEMIDSFDPDSINITHDNFDPTIIDNINISSEMNFEEKNFIKIKNTKLKNLENNYNFLKEKQQKNRVNSEKRETIDLMSNDILEFANTIPLLKTSNAKLIQATIKKNKHFLIKFKKPKNIDISFKKIATLSFPESNIKKLETINDLVGKIKSFNKVNEKIFFVNKEFIYIPLSFLK